MILNINDTEVVAFTRKLEKMHRKHLPSAVRNTLNDVALNGTKKNSLLKTTSKKFTQRQKNFFRVGSNVDFAKGWQISNMKSVVGMSDKRVTGSQAIDDLREQEQGGTIDGRSFIPLKGARVSNSWGRMVRKKYRLSNIQNKIVDADKNRKGSNKNQKWVLSSIYAGVGGFVIGTNKIGGGSRILYEIKNLHKKGRGYSIGAHPIYSVRSGRSVRVKSTNFMKKSADIAARDIGFTFNKMAKRELAR